MMTSSCRVNASLRDPDPASGDAIARSGDAALAFGSAITTARHSETDSARLLTTRASPKDENRRGALSWDLPTGG